MQTSKQNTQNNLQQATNTQTKRQKNTATTKPTNKQRKDIKTKLQRKQGTRQSLFFFFPMSHPFQVSVTAENEEASANAF